MGYHRDDAHARDHWPAASGGSGSSAGDAFIASRPRFRRRELLNGFHTIFGEPIKRLPGCGILNAPANSPSAPLQHHFLPALSKADAPSLAWEPGANHHSIPKSQCAMACASFAGLWGETRLTIMSTATSAPPIVLAAIAIANDFAVGRSLPMDVIGNASNPRGSRTREDFCRGLQIEILPLRTEPPVIRMLGAFL